jgi:uncharacterized protein
MTAEHLVFLSLAIGAVAFLYSSVGHAGASGYIAVMSLAELEPKVIKPTALTLNILVAAIATWQFASRGHFSWRLFWPFALLAVPMAFLGGYLDIPTAIFKVIVGIVLLISALRFLMHPSEDTSTNPPSLAVSIPIGGGLGLLSGLTGTGGGIFLTPLLLFMRWAKTKQAAGVSALFILLNSMAGLLGNISSTKSFPTFAFPLAIAAISAGLAGSYFGSQRFPHTTIKRLLAAVLLIAGTKLLMTAAS